MSKTKRLYFTKMEGAGNDYVYVDCLGRPTSLPTESFDFPELSRKISDRHFGVGSDGLIVILPSASADFRMRMFNSDGSEAQMCGNGTRCVAKYLYDKKFTDKEIFTLETKAGIKTLTVHLRDGVVEEVTVNMGRALINAQDIPVVGTKDERVVDTKVTIGDETFEVTAIGMGNPHGVIFVDDITDTLIYGVGPQLEKHQMWPEKANIEFAKVIDRDNIEMRVWERGSGETLACGTGACATAVAATIKGLTNNKVNLRLRGGILKIEYDTLSGEVLMTGPARFIAEGNYFI